MCAQSNTCECASEAVRCKRGYALPYGLWSGSVWVGSNLTTRLLVSLGFTMVLYSYPQWLVALFEVSA